MTAQSDGVTSVEYVLCKKTNNDQGFNVHVFPDGNYMFIAKTENLANIMLNPEQKLPVALVDFLGETPKFIEWVKNP